MFDTSWGEIIVLTGVCMALVGRKDLPKASRFVGSQVGRAVGFLQGAKIRADRFAAQNELRQLQNELRKGLRELDAVKAEIAVTASSSRALGPTVPSANRILTDAITDHTTVDATLSSTPMDVSRTTATSTPTSKIDDNTTFTSRPLAPRSQAVAAVAEEEWEKQGIGFRSRAETRGSDTGAGPSGAKILAKLLQQSLIYDQHDRVVQEQQDALQSRVEDRQKKDEQPIEKKQ